MDMNAELEIIKSRYTEKITYFEEALDFVSKQKGKEG